VVAAKVVFHRLPGRRRIAVHHQFRDLSQSRLKATSKMVNALATAIVLEMPAPLASVSFAYNNVYLEDDNRRAKRRSSDEEKIAKLELATAFVNVLLINAHNRCFEFCKSFKTNNKTPSSLTLSASAQ